MIRTPDRQGAAYEQADMIAYILHNPEKPSENNALGGGPSQGNDFKNYSPISAEPRPATLFILGKPGTLTGIITL